MVEQHGREQHGREQHGCEQHGCEQHACEQHSRDPHGHAQHGREQHRREQPSRWGDTASVFEPAVGVARQFLRRWDDAFTASRRDDIAQQAAVDAVCAWDSLRDKACFDSVVRTIARRLRANAVREGVRLPTRSLDTDHLITETAPAGETRGYPVRGVFVDECEMLAALPDILAKLPPINAALLLSYYEGFSMSELAERYALQENVVKGRIHRSRCHIKRSMESMVVEDSGELREDTEPRHSLM